MSHIISLHDCNNLQYSTILLILAICYYKDPHNQAVVNILIREVMGLNPSFLTQHIRGKPYPLSRTGLRFTTYYSYVDYLYYDKLVLFVVHSAV